MGDMKKIMETWRSYEKKTLLAEQEADKGSVRLRKKGAAVLNKQLKNAAATEVVPLVKFLNSPAGKDPKVRAALSQGTGDGKPGDEVINVKPATPVVSGMSPTQNEISLAKSIGFPLSSTETLSNVKTGDPTGKGMKIVTAGDLVIDGHHRWSSVFSVDPGGKILAIDMQLPGDDAGSKLAVAQTAIAATMDPGAGDVPKATTGGANDNILGKSSEEIAEMIKGLVGTNMDSGLPLLGDKYLAAVKNSKEGADYFGLQPNMDNNQARQTIINKVAQNLSALPAPQGPVRDYMPQFDGGDTHKGQVKLAQVVDKMKSGEVNYKAPFEE